MRAKKKLGVEEIRCRCGACGKSADQKLLTSCTVVETFDDEDFGYGMDLEFSLSSCPACDRINLTVEHDGDIKTLYPVRAKDLEGLPEEIAKAYKAASAVRDIDANAFAVLIGRLLELVCRDRGAIGKDLNAQLQDLVNKGEIPGRLAEMAHQLRALRNIGAHASLGELTLSEVPIVDDLCRSILEYVYSAPSRIGRVEERIKKLKKT